MFITPFSTRTLIRWSLSGHDAVAKQIGILLVEKLKLQQEDSIAAFSRIQSIDAQVDALSTVLDEQQIHAGLNLDPRDAGIPAIEVSQAG